MLVLVTSRRQANQLASMLTTLNTAAGLQGIPTVVDLTLATIYIYC